MLDPNEQTEPSEQHDDEREVWVPPAQANRVAVAHALEAKVIESIACVESKLDEEDVKLLRYRIAVALHTNRHLIAAE